MTRPLRVLSWNLRHLHDDRRAIVRVLRAADADLVFLQEGPRQAVAGTRTLRRLAGAAGLHVVGGGRAAAGNALLRSDRVTVTDVETVRFPLNRRFGQRRGTVVATIGTGGAALRVACVHLGLEGQERLAHVAEILRRLGSGPALVAGDLNEPPGGPSWRALEALVRDPAPGAPVTFSVASPRRRIDAVLVSAGVRTLEYGEWQADPEDVARATDHLPVLTVVELG